MTKNDGFGGALCLTGLTLVIGACSSDGSGGTDATGGVMNTGGAGATAATGGSPAGGGTPGAPSGGGTTSGTGGGGGASGGGAASGGASTGGAASGGASTGGAASGGESSGGSMTGGSGGSTSGSGGEFTGTCTASEGANRNVSGSGPYDVVVETNSDPGINEGTIYRPSELGGAEKYPIFVWGEGGCSQDGYSNASAMAEIASYGYFVVADGTPNGSGNRGTNGDGGPLLAYIDWAIAENGKPCSAYYQSIDTAKVSSNGFSCGGLMAAGTAEDPRMTTWGHTSSGLFGGNQSFYQAVHSPVLILTGTNDDLAYENGVRDYEGIAAAGNVPVMLFAKAGAGHGGDLFQQDGGEFTEVILAWLNWWLKDDEGATGKGALVGASCSYCSDASWDVQSTNVP